MDEEYAPSKEAWKSILRLADMWKFDGVRKLAIKRLGKLALGPVEKIELCGRFDIEDSWASKAVTALCVRKEPLSIDEAHRVGLGKSVFIAQAREQDLRKQLENIQQRQKIPDFQSWRDCRLTNRSVKPKADADGSSGKSS
jgi:hypothetical protein